MKFEGASEPYAEVLADIGKLCDSVSALAGQTVVIELHDDFDSLPQAVGSDAKRQTPAGYIPSRGVVAINRSIFDLLPVTEQRGVLLHEVGHAMRHRAGTAERVGDCIGADLAVIEWGLAGEIIEAREATYGTEYGRLLRSAQSNPAEARGALTMWWMQLQAGIIRTPTRRERRAAARLLDRLLEAAVATLPRDPTVLTKPSCAQRGCTLTSAAVRGANTSRRLRSSAT